VFLSKLVKLVDQPDRFLSGLRAPDGWFMDIIHHFSEHYLDQKRSRPIRIDGGDTSVGPLKIISSATPSMKLRVRTVKEFLERSEDPGPLYIVENLNRDTWPTWRPFLYQFRTAAELAKSFQDRFPPKILLCLPGDTRHAEFKGLLDKRDILKWKGVLGRIDMTVLADFWGIYPETFMEMVARETSIEVAAYNVDLLEALLKCSTEEQVNPIPVIQEKMRASGSNEPMIAGFSWDRSEVDMFDGEVRPDTVALALRGRINEIEKYIWRAHMRIGMVQTDEVREYLISKHGKTMTHILRTNPIIIRNKDGVEKHRKTDPNQLECGDMIHLNHSLPFMDRDDLSLAYSARNLRNDVAHYKPITRDKIIELQRRLVYSEPDKFSEPGWDWPRCGQVLRMVIGPSGAGKTTYALKYHRNDYISRDEIREKLKAEKPDQHDLEKQVVKRFFSSTISRLSRGDNVLMDATFLSKDIRDGILNQVPTDIKVEYIVIDRPLDEKVATAGWRITNEKNVVQEHHDEFQRAINDILEGDCRPNVIVVDKRKFGEALDQYSRLIG
jgi:predicted kinase